MKKPKLGLALTLAFILLKVWGVIDWHWVWVLSPLWIGLPFMLICITVFLITIRD